MFILDIFFAEIQTNIIVQTKKNAFMVSEKNKIKDSKSKDSSPITLP